MLRGVGWGCGVWACRGVGGWNGARRLRGMEGAEGVVPCVPRSDYPPQPGLLGSCGGKRWRSFRGNRCRENAAYCRTGASHPVNAFERLLRGWGTPAMNRTQPFCPQPSV